MLCNQYLLLICSEIVYTAKVVVCNKTRSPALLTVYDNKRGLPLETEHIYYQSNDLSSTTSPF